MLIQLILLGGGLVTYLNQRNKSNSKTIAQPLESQKKEEQTASSNFSGKKLLQDFKTAILGDERQQQQLTLDPERQADFEKYEKEANRNRTTYRRKNS